MNKVVISVTGHRLLTSEVLEKIEPVIKKAIENILFTVGEHDPHAVFSAVSPLAEGADTLFARVALSLNLPLKVMLPFEQDEYIRRFSSERAKSEFEDIIRKLDSKDIKVAGSIRGSEENQLYLDMGKKLIDETDFLVAVWNEKPGRGKGGTADVLSYAIDKGINILLINPEELQPHINYLHKGNFRRNENREVIDTASTNRLNSFISEKQEEYDANAGLYNRKYKRLWTAGFVMGLVEVLAFACINSFHVNLTLNFLLSTLEFLCLAVIILLVLFGRSVEYHSSYVHNRIVAERLRIKRFFSELGLRIFHTSVSPIYFSFKEKPEYNILDNTIRLINLSAYSYLSMEEKKRRIENELLLDQYAYHEKKKERFEQKNSQYKRVRGMLFVIFALAVTFHFSHVANEFFLHHHLQLTTWHPPMFHSELFEEFVLFFSIFIPATIAACEALKYLYEWEQIINLSASMATYFKEKSKKIAHIHTEEQLEHFMNAINRDMLIENLDWEKYMQDKNEVPT